MVTVAELMAVIGLDDTKLRQGLAHAHHQLEEFGGEIKELGKGVSEMFDIALAGIAEAVLESGNQVNAAFNRIVIQTGATGEKLSGLKDTFAGVYGEVSQGAGDVGNALGLLAARTGLTGEALEHLTRQGLDLARMQGTDLTQTLGDVTRFFGDSSIATDKQSAAMDFLFRVSQKTGTTVDSLTQKMVFYGAPLRQMGIGWQQAALLMGKWEKEGVNTELVMGSLRIALMKFSAQGIKDPAAALPLLIDKIKEAKTQGEATAIAMTYFGSRAGADMAAAVREGRFAIGDLVKSMKEASDGIEETSEKSKPLIERFEELRHKVEVIIAPIGQQFVKALGDVVTKIQGPLLEGLKSAIKWWNELSPSTKTAALALTAVVASIGPVIFAVGALITAFSAILPGLGIVVAFLMGPWGLAIAAVGAALYFLTMHGARNLTEWMNNIKEFFAWGKPFFLNSWNAIKDIVVGVWKVLADTVGTSVEIVIHIITAIIDFMKGDWRGAWDEVKAAFAALWDSLVDLVTQALPRIVQGVKNLLKGIWGAVTGGTAEQVKALNEQVAKDSVQHVTESLADQHLRETCAKAGELLGNDFVGGLQVGIGKESDAQTKARINKILDAGIDKRKVKPKLTEGDKEMKELQAAIKATNTEVAEMENGHKAAIAKIYAHYHDLTKGAIEPLIEAQRRLKTAMDIQQQSQKAINAIAEAKAKIVELKTAGLGIREALDFTYPMLSSTKAGRLLLEGLAKTLKVQKELTEEAKIQKEHADKRESQVRSERGKVTELQAEYLKLTHTHQDDQLALETTGQLFEDLDFHMQDLIRDQEYWMGLVKKEKDNTAELTREKNLTDEVTASIARMRHELTLKSEAEEEGLGKKRAITPFANLPEADQMAEIDEWMGQHKIAIDKMTLADVALARSELEVKHQLDAKKQSDIDAAEATKKSTDLTESLQHKLDEVKDNLAAIKGEAPKHSAMVAKLMGDIQQGAIKLTDKQKELFDAIVAGEDQAPIDKLTEDIKKRIGEVNAALDQLGGHKHSAYTRLLEDLKEHGKLTADQVALLKQLEDAEDKVTAKSKQFDAMKQLAAGVKQVMTGMFTDIIEKGKLSFKSITQSFTQMLQKMAEEYLASEAIRLLFGAFGYDSQGVKIPHRASGGQVDGGQTYLVGENGPELFRAPSNGSIATNSQLRTAAAGAGGNTTVHITVHAADAQSFRLSNQQVAEDMQRALEQARRRNG